MKTTVFVGFLLVLAGFFSEATGQNGDWSNLLGAKSDTLQNSYFLKRLNIQFDRRRSEVKKALQSKSKLLKRQEFIRRWYAGKVGPLPPKTPLNPVFSAKVDMGLYTIEKVSFESKPNHHITGLFYTPAKGRKPFPAVYIPCGHTKVAKAEEDYQKAARLFALNGFVVLQADPICQGERFQYLDQSGKPVTREGTYMHEQLGHAMLLTGKNTLIEELEDNIRCLDLLEKHPLVDKEKLAVAGHSGGGTQTTYLAAFDRRVKAATPVCYIATSEEKLNTIGSQDGCQQLWYEGGAGIEEQDFLFMAAPAPICILATDDDFFPIKGARIAFNDLKQMYSVLHIPEKVGFVSCPGEHGWHRPLREASVGWCKRWLLNDSSPVTEPDDIGFFKEENQVNVCSTGQVMTSFPGEKSVTDFTRERAELCRRHRAEFQKTHSAGQILSQIKSLLNIEIPDRNTRADRLESKHENGYRIDKIQIERDPKLGFNLLALLYLPDKATGKLAATIVISQDGKTSKPLADQISEELKQGHIVLAIDICNTGELADKRPIDSNNREFWIGKLPLFEGKTLLTYRVEDLLLAVGFLKQQDLADVNDIRLISVGYTGPAALHAAAIGKCFSKVKIIGSLSSWDDVAFARHSKNQIGNIVPDALNYYDLPDLIKLAPETQVEIILPVDAEENAK